MTEPSVRPSSRMGRVVVFTWLLLVTTLSALNHVSLSRLSREIVTQSNDAQIADLQNRLTAAEHTLQSGKRQPPIASSADLVEVRQALNERLNNLKQDFENSSGKEEFLLLQGRMKNVEAQMRKLTRDLSSRPPSGPTPSTAMEPPFAVLGIEVRGGDRVLAVMPAGSSTLLQTRLLRIGDSEDNWRLEGLTGNVADFRIDGRTQRIVVQ